MSNGGGRFVIPAKVKKVIQNIKEISGNHDDEEVYYMLKECNMDPNETAQQLLSQGRRFFCCIYVFVCVYICCICADLIFLVLVFASVSMNCVFMCVCKPNL